ncbi:multi antimicrobial extrusion protein MatE [Actinomadura sp. KC06]|uniref:lipopolysaccharide biosynthesis protein n=1 Tax=Actinomadura sp. KC06 TaxID=2530369 RepID=UPI0010456FB3|nr:polysaccharide biosynthesis C-terminal domain-containing protein [Actinomadura sp. KC06]TDD27946.1 multi antimicrobial extrusion protein MatE [Actinomadura sp. KC06]
MTSTSEKTTTPTRGTADLRALARGGVLNFMGAGFAAVAQFLSVVVLTRGFSKQEAGVFFAATTVFLMGLALARLGTDVGLVYFIARTRALGLGHRVAAYVRAAFGPTVVAAIVIAAVLYAAAPWIAEAAVDGPADDGARYLRALALFLPAAAVSDAALAATRGYRSMRPTALVENIARQGLQLSLLACLALFGATSLLGAAWAGPYIVSAVIAVLLLRGLMRRPVPPPEPAVEASEKPGEEAARGGTAGEFWRYTAPRAIASVAQIVLQRFDIVLVAAMLGPVQAAVYTAATRYVVVGQIGNQALGQAVQPQLSAVLSRGDMAGARSLYQTATCWLVLLTWPVYLVFATFAPYSLQLFGGGYEEGADVVLILSLTMLFATICGQVDTVLIMAGKTTWNLANIVTAMTVNIVADLLLIPRLGITGAAAGWAIALFVKNVVPLAQIAHVLRLHPFGRGTLTAAALAGVGFGVLPLTTRLLLDGLLPLLIATFAGACLYGAGCLLRRDVLRLDEIRRIRRRAAPS